MWTGFSLYLLINPNEYFQELVELEMPPLYFRFAIIGFSILQVSSSPFPLSSVPSFVLINRNLSFIRFYSVC